MARHCRGCDILIKDEQVVTEKYSFPCDKGRITAKIRRCSRTPIGMCAKRPRAREKVRASDRPTACMRRACIRVSYVYTDQRGPPFCTSGEVYVKGTLVARACYRRPECARMRRSALFPLLNARCRASKDAHLPHFPLSRVRGAAVYCAPSPRTRSLAPSLALSLSLSLSPSVRPSVRPSVFLSPPLALALSLSTV
jgi:hypothetical protein